jgi:hypothetical protein
VLFRENHAFAGLETACAGRDHARIRDAIDPVAEVVPAGIIALIVVHELAGSVWETTADTVAHRTRVRVAYGIVDPCVAALRANAVPIEHQSARAGEQAASPQLRARVRIAHVTVVLASPVLTFDFPESHFAMPVREAAGPRRAIARIRKTGVVDVTQPLAAVFVALLFRQQIALAVGEAADADLGV